MDDKKPETAACVRPANGPNAGYFPNAVVVTHEGRRALFYDDLLRGKTAIVHFFSTRDAAAPRLAANLARVQPYLGARLGRDVFLYSLTTDPLHDTPAVLEAFAAGVEARPGWLFLTGEPATMELLKGRMFSGTGGHHHDASAEDCSLGMIRYGNEAVGIWGSAPASSPPETIAQRLSWVMTRPASEGGFQRRGPTPLRAGLSAGVRK